MAPSSARRPAGHQPPWGSSSSMAASSAPRSAPVWPPETMVSRLHGVHRLDLGGEVLVDHLALDLERRGQLAVLDGERPRQDGELLDLLDLGQRAVDVVDGALHGGGRGAV